MSLMAIGYEKGVHFSLLWEMTCSFHLQYTDITVEQEYTHLCIIFQRKVLFGSVDVCRRTIIIFTDLGKL